MKKKAWQGSIILLLFFVFSSLTVFAENRALLVGVGNYQNSNFNLQGIDKDLNMMKEVAGHMDFLTVRLRS